VFNSGLIWDCNSAPLVPACVSNIDHNVLMHRQTGELLEHAIMQTSVRKITDFRIIKQKNVLLLFLWTLRLQSVIFYSTVNGTHFPWDTKCSTDPASENILNHSQYQVVLSPISCHTGPEQMHDLIVHRHQPDRQLTVLSCHPSSHNVDQLIV